MTVSSVRVEGIKEIGDRLRALPPMLGSKGGGPLRYALAKAARLIRDAAVGYAPEDTGALKENIITKRHRNPKAVGATERYDVGMRGGTRVLTNNRWNRSKGTAGKRVSTAGKVWYGRMVETGTSKMTSRETGWRPFLRPAIDNNWSAAVDVFRVEFLKAVEKAEKKLGSRR